MSLYDYETSRKLSADDAPFAALIMAAMRRADTFNAGKLRTAFPEIWAELQERHDAPGGRIADELLAERFRSRDPEHWREDLTASLDLASAEGLLDADERCLVVEAFAERGPQGALRELAERAPLAFGLAARFHIEARTSLMGDAESATRVALNDSWTSGGLGLTVGDLGWPKSALEWDDDNATEEDPALEARLTRAIELWRAEHSDD